MNMTMTINYLVSASRLPAPSSLSVSDPGPVEGEVVLQVLLLLLGHPPAPPGVRGHAVAALLPPAAQPEAGAVVAAGLLLLMNCRGRSVVTSARGKLSSGILPP